MGVDLVRSLQPPDILWIHWKVCNSIANTSKGELVPPPLYFNKTLWHKKSLLIALSDQASSLVRDWILLWRPRIPASLHGSATTLHPGGSSGILQDKVWTLGALVLCSPSEHIFCSTLLTLLCACVKRPVWSKWGALLCGSVVTSYGLWQKPVGGLYRPDNAKRHPASPSGTNQKWAKHMDWTLLSRSNFLVSLTIS